MRPPLLRHASALVNATRSRKYNGAASRMHRGDSAAVIEDPCGDLRGRGGTRHEIAIGIGQLCLRTCAPAHRAS